MSNTPALDAPTLTIPDALRVLGTGKEHRPDSRIARVRLETAPLPDLLEVLPTLWATERSKYERRIRIGTAVIAVQIVTGLLFFIAANIVQKQTRGSSFMLSVLRYAPSVGIMLPGLITRFTSRMNATHKGIVRLLHIRPTVEMVPLMIEVLSLGRNAVDDQVGWKSWEDKHRYLLTWFLPLWCAGDTDDLTPRQRKKLCWAN